MEKVEKGLYVSVDYKGTLQIGEVFDTSHGSRPLEVQMGAGQLIEGFERELVPVAESLGMKLAGCYRWFGACGESGEIVSFWSLQNWAHWGRIREAQLNEQGFRRWMDKASGLCAEWSYKFLIPVPYSMLH